MDARRALEGQVVVVTGASSGIGAATARLLVREGARLMLAARREAPLRALREALGEQVAYRCTDVRSHADMLALASAAQQTFGALDALVNNAGVMPLSYFASRKVSEWDTLIDVNIKGVLYGIDAVLTPMLEQGHGHIVNVSSVAGHWVRPGFGVYSATKHAVRVISEGLRQECAGKVRVTLISPGAVSTELTASITDDGVRDMLASGPRFPFLQPEDVAEAIRYALCQPANAAVNEITLRPAAQPD